MTKAEVFAQNISKSGYGDDYETILKILNKLTPEEVDSLAYNCYRTAEKISIDALDCDQLFTY